MHNRLSQVLGITFHDERLLQSALIHRSFFHEHPERADGLSSNERLEFLGDAVLNFLTAAWLYTRFPQQSEGDLTRLRAALVKRSTLAGFARQLNLGDYLRISRGAESLAARKHETLLSDGFEAVVGAIYLDQGIETVRAFVEPFLEREIDTIVAAHGGTDYRTRLQALLQQQHGVTPEYRTVTVTGPAHRAHFTVEVLLEERRIGLGSGATKQAAAQEAARTALEYLAL
jgi:ribonuclease-3